MHCGDRFFFFFSIRARGICLGCTAACRLNVQPWTPSLILDVPAYAARRPHVHMTWETPVAKGGTCGWELSIILPECRLPRYTLEIFYVLQICDIFSPLKIRRLRPGLNPRTWVLQASTLPLDHQSRYGERSLQLQSLTTFAITYTTSVHTKCPWLFIIFHLLFVKHKFSAWRTFTVNVWMLLRIVTELVHRAEQWTVTSKLPYW